jgi:hypothetical protein
MSFKQILGDEKSTYSGFKLALIIFSFFFEVPGFELRAYTLSHSISPFFVMGFFQIGSLKLFPWAGFE